MNRKLLIATAAVIGIASTAVIATAHDRGNGPGKGHGPAALFERFDTNGDGTITKAEVEAAAAARFTEADSNGDGVLSAEEMTAAAEGRRANRRAERIAKRIEMHDANGDGMLSLEEVTAAAGDGRANKMFEHLDTDGDGTITKAEAEAAKPMRRGGRGWHGNGKN